GARSASGVAERSSARLVDPRMVVGSAEYAARERMGCVLPEGPHRWLLPERAHLVRICGPAFPGYGRDQGKVARARQGRESFRGTRAAARDQAAAKQGLFP